MQSNAIRVGGSDVQHVGFATISIHRPHYNDYVVTVEDTATGQLIEGLSSRWGDPAQANAAARNAVQAFASGRTVEQVINQLIDDARRQMGQALNRDNKTRAAELDELIDRLTPEAEREAENAVLADLSDRLTRRQEPALSGLGQIKAQFAAGMERDRAERATRRELGQVA
jgi:hypothetical protein